jgi:hypothetical protein
MIEEILCHWPMSIESWLAALWGCAARTFDSQRLTASVQQQIKPQSPLVLIIPRKTVQLELQHVMMQ